MAVAVAIWALAPLLPYWRGIAPASPFPKEAPLKVITWNVLWSNPQKKEALAWLGSQQDADLILLTECTADWRAALAPLTASYPHQLSSGRDGAEGMWLLSRYPLDPPDPEGLAANKPWLSTIVHGPWGPLRFLGMHPRTPRAGARFDERNAQFDGAAAISAQATLPVLLMGDLNCTPFSPWFSRLLERGALRDSAIGFGLTGTWTGQGVRLPIDHILVNKHLRVLDYHVEAEWHGSDHHPVTATLAVQCAP
jgi:endonuclease/exonuclease/phosphatase (EEP) superfamily protein YafD